MSNGVALFVRFNLVDDVGNALKVSLRHRCLSVGVGVHLHAYNITDNMPDVKRCE